MTNEKQKPITKEYRNNWDAIFKQAKELTKNIKLVNEEFNKEYDKLDKTK